MPTASYFANYWQAVESFLGCNPKHRASAIRLGGADALALDGVALIHRLWEAMHGEHWSRPVSASTDNWMWRERLSEHSHLSPEVALERAVVALGGTADWTYQMPTASGLHGPSTDKRRSIDLVRRHAEGHYAFIELKVGSDQPLYAAFELLGYGLAYLHARRNGHRGSGQHDVMTARRIDLVVLGPEEWYHYAARGGRRQSFEFGPLAEAINAGLADTLQERPLSGLEEMGFRFERFQNRPSPEGSAAEIVHRS